MFHYRFPPKYKLVSTGKYMFSLVERSIHTAWKPFCKFDRFFSVTGSATILGNESINFFNNEKKIPLVGELLLQKLIQVYCSGKVTLYYFETCLF